MATVYKGCVLVGTDKDKVDDAWFMCEEGLSYIDLKEQLTFEEAWKQLCLAVSKIGPGKKIEGVEIYPYSLGPAT